jgi:DNA-binding transcriptional MerR regulator
MSGGRRGIYSISAVAQMLEIPAPTLRTWEDRYQLVVPDRSAAGRRLYSRDELEQLQFVKSQIDGGVTAADAHRLLAERIETAGPLTAGPATRRGHLLVLLAEKDPYAAELQEYFLRTEGFEVDVALDESGARSSFMGRPPSLVLIELLISGGSGLGLCRSFKDRGGVPVIAVSSLESRDLAMEAGADAFLLKPLDPLELVSTVRDLLGSSALVSRSGDSDDR